jgi:hypothetical protein
LKGQIITVVLLLGEGEKKAHDPLASVEAVLGKHRLCTIHRAPIDGSCMMAIMAGPHGATATVRIYPQGTLTVTLEYYVTKGQSPLFSTKVSPPCPFLFVLPFNDGERVFLVSNVHDEEEN